MDKVLGEDAKKRYSHCKIHTQMFEHKGKIWFATHTAFYEGGLPGVDLSGNKPTYSGGHFMNYDLESGEFTDLAHIVPNEGIITMTMDKKNEILYGMTWPSGLLISYDIKNKDLRYWAGYLTHGLGQSGKPAQFFLRTEHGHISAGHHLPNGAFTDARKQFASHISKHQIGQIGQIQHFEMILPAFKHLIDQRVKGFD